jgi:hypothetical protein
MRRLWILFVFLFAEAFSFPQDSTETVVILSGKVGPTLDLEERNYYRMFAAHRQFESAVLVQKPDGTYAFKIFSRTKDGAPGGIAWMPVTRAEVERIRRYIEIYAGPETVVPPLEEPSPVYATRPGKLWTLILSDSLEIPEVRLLRTDTDSLEYSDQNQILRVALESLREIRATRESVFWRGTLFGVLAGAALGGLLGQSSYEEPGPDDWMQVFDRRAHTTLSVMGGGLIGLLTGGIVFEIISGITHDDEIHNLANSTPDQKCAILEKIILEQRFP